MRKQNSINKLSRRSFIRNSVIAATGVTLLPTLLTSCNDDADFVPVYNNGFHEGVASFDPTQESVILWTRYTPSPDKKDKSRILLDVATDSSFKEVLVSQSVEIDLKSDNTVYVDVKNLESDTKYYYRFRNLDTGAASVVGETKTLPATGEASEVKVAVVSCANYQAGLFNVYGAVAESEADIVLHLGDYIYEYGVNAQGPNGLVSSQGRDHHPKGEAITIEDYRARYRQYRRDEQLQKAHQLKPFICVWDDHEIAKDAHKDGSDNHQPGEGDFTTRKMNALQVWHEYLPARVDDKAKIYRNFEIAGIVNLMVLDTRIIGRDKQLDYKDYLTPNGINSAAFLSDWKNPNRSLLGSEQRSWLTATLQSSSAKWQVLGNQVLMGKIYVPAELIGHMLQFSAGNVSDELITQYTALITELVLIKVRVLQGDRTVSDTDRARVENVLPYNLDAWDGYPVEREAVLTAASGKKLLSLAGDTHNAWSSTLSDAKGKKVGVEFATASVSSHGLEAVLGKSPKVLAGVELALPILVDDLKYLNASQRGYLMVTFSMKAVQADWRFIGTLATKNTSTISGNTAIEA